VKKPQSLEKRRARLGVKNIYGFEFLMGVWEVCPDLVGIVAMAFYLQRVLSELEERTSAFGSNTYALAYVINQRSGCSRLETLVAHHGVYRLLRLRRGRASCCSGRTHK
jgi:hypothetical protein